VGLRTCPVIGRAAATSQPCFEAIQKIGDFETSILMHNDAVVQGLSEVPFMQDVEKCGVFTIGTGLGNALFSNRRAHG
jgi:hypothetical protein